VVEEAETREGEKRPHRQARFRDYLNGLQRFAAIAETAAMSAYSIWAHVATSGGGWYRLDGYHRLNSLKTKTLAGKNGGS
jgi:hypothetical protein